MSDYSFSEEQKVSHWRADGEKCFYCGVPVPYRELQIEHIIPEKVRGEASRAEVGSPGRLRHQLNP